LASSTNSAPSWSWPGWSGGIDSPFHEKNQIKSSSSPNLDYLNGRNSYLSSLFSPIVEWYSSDSFSHEGKCHIASQGPGFYNPSLEKRLPSGWSRHSANLQPTRGEIPPAKVMQELSKLSPVLGEYYYTHTYDPNTQFWLPIPIRDRYLPEIIAPVHRYISCRTNMITIFNTEKAMLEKDLSSPFGMKSALPCLILKNELGEFLGVFKLG